MYFLHKKDFSVSSASSKVFSKRSISKHLLMFQAQLMGIPLGSRPSSNAFWSPVIERIKERLNPWRRKFLSKSGRVVLIKSVLSSIPTYFMSLFKIPVGVALNIEKLQRGFLWGDGLEKRKVHAVKWEKVCLSKDYGGLGIERVVVKNKALLAK